MAQISVVELCYDPDFVDTCTVLRQVQVVGDDGNAVYQTKSFPIVASMQSGSGDNLNIGEDSTHTEGSYEIITAFPLAAATSVSAADEVIWRGLTYIVKSVGRFGNFAGSGGHYEGVCELKTLITGTGPP